MRSTDRERANVFFGHRGRRSVTCPGREVYWAQPLPCVIKVIYHPPAALHGLLLRCVGPCRRIAGLNGTTVQRKIVRVISSSYSCEELRDNP